MCATKSVLTPAQYSAIRKAAFHAGLDFVRFFGSSLQSLTGARDIDVIIGAKPLTLDALSKFSSALEKLFKKPIDIIQLRSNLSPTLILEIARTSAVIWEKPRTGLITYIELIDKLVAVAADEKLAFPAELQKLSIKQRSRSLGHVT